MKNRLNQPAEESLSSSIRKRGNSPAEPAGPGNASTAMVEIGRAATSTQARERFSTLRANI